MGNNLSTLNQKDVTAEVRYSDLKGRPDLIKPYIMNNAIYLLMIALVLVYVFRILKYRFEYNRKKREYLIKKNNKGVISEITKELRKNEMIGKFLENLANKIGMYNPYSLERNLEYATTLVLGLFFFIIIVLATFMPGQFSVWYLGVFFAILSIGFVGLMLYVFTLMARMRFTRQLPDTFKLLNSRYINTGNILKAINNSMGDFDRAVKREMLRIYDVLRKNDMMEIDATFDRIENTYSNEHLTLLLNLIRQAHFKGGSETIKEQFEQATEDILIDIENQRDLTSSTRSYVLMSLLIAGGIVAVETFNKTALEGEALAYYDSTDALMFKISIIIVMMLYVGMMLFLERKG